MIKINRIISLVDDKSAALLTDYSYLVESQADSEDLGYVRGQIAMLDELRKDIKIIQSEDD